MPVSIKTDILIIGAGIAGLWLLNRLKQLGYNAILLENNSIGSGQTIASQGIIHGGAKYSLTGKLNAATDMVADMPQFWRNCIQGIGNVDLTGVNILSEHQYLWSTQTLASRMAAFFGSKTLRSKIQALDRDTFPSFFQHALFKGKVYELQEIVIDIPSLLKKLTQQYASFILHTPSLNLKFDDQGNVIQCEAYLNDNTPILFEAQTYLLTAGAGNETLLKNAIKPIAMQRRPLQMAIVKHPYLQPLYAHCISMHTKPRVTITTHYTTQGEMIWYIGGLLAENGVHQTSQELIHNTHLELKTLFPWIDLSNATITTYPIDRAEPAQKEGQLPGEVYAKIDKNIITAWPVKLALAPKLSQLIESILSQKNLQPLYPINELLFTLPKASLAQPIWDR
ncbi:MAG: putative FAD-dependent oxidoreductase [Legionellaceae bacterium]